MSKPGKWPPTGFGEQLKKLRTERDLTQHQLAALVGVHYMTIYHLETGLHEPAWPLVLALAQALAVSINDFERHEPEPPSTPKPRRRKKP